MYYWCWSKWIKVTCKTFVEQGFNVIVLEKNSHNGLFHNIPEKEYFRWSSSRYISGYSDFPIPKSYPTWMTIKDFTKYLKSYKDTFKLDKYIKYKCNVIKTTKINNKWKVTYNKNSKLFSIIVDKLIVCSGLNSVPKYPNLNNYTGKILHTDDIYKQSKENWKQLFTNKKILLLGGGESAFDIGHLCLQYTDKLYFATKSYIEWFPDGGHSIENDSIKDCSDKYNIGPLPYPTDTLLNYIEYSLPTPVSGLWHEYGRYFVKKFFSRKNICSHHHEELCNITKTPSNLFRKYVVKRTPFLCDIHENKVNIIKYPKKYKNKSVIIEEGIEIKDVDIIICATGYKMKFNFLDEKYYKTSLIKKMVPHNYDSIAFIGFTRPTMGSLINIAEYKVGGYHYIFKIN